MSHSQEKRQLIEAKPDMTQKLKLANKNFKAPIIIILKDIKKKVCNELKDKKILAEKQKLQKNQMKILDPKIQYPKFLNVLDGRKS